MSRKIDLTGKCFGRLTVIKEMRTVRKRPSQSYVYWKCLCSCGREKEITTGGLLNGHTKSCGCLQKDIFKQNRTDRITHGCSHSNNGKPSIEYMMWRSAKHRAKKKGIPFELKFPDDIVIPDYCPVLGIKLIKTNTRQAYNSPSLDRIIPKLGYVKGNIAIISVRANAIKQNASYEEIDKVAKWLKIKVTGIDKKL